MRTQHTSLLAVLLSTTALTLLGASCEPAVENFNKIDDEPLRTAKRVSHLPPAATFLLLSPADELQRIQPSFDVLTPIGSSGVVSGVVSDVAASDPASDPASGQSISASSRGDGFCPAFSNTNASVDKTDALTHLSEKLDVYNAPLQEYTDLLRALIGVGDAGLSAAVAERSLGNHDIEYSLKVESREISLFVSLAEDGNTDYTVLARNEDDGIGGIGILLMAGTMSADALRGAWTVYDGANIAWEGGWTRENNTLTVIRQTANDAVGAPDLSQQKRSTFIATPDDIRIEFTGPAHLGVAYWNRATAAGRIIVAGPNEFERKYCWNSRIDEESAQAAICPSACGE